MLYWFGVGNVPVGMFVAAIKGCIQANVVAYKHCVLTVSRCKTECYAVINIPVDNCLWPVDNPSGLCRLPTERTGGRDAG